jgi:cyclopropane fatty-acyl-phospholipid synthase-like methyltransferase
MEEIEGKDLLFAFFDECYRILKPKGVMTVICPNARSNRAFQDPTHRRFIVAETFLYFNKEWRVMNKLDHYHVKCDFSTKVVPIVTPEVQKCEPQEQSRLIHHYWNFVLDWQAVMVATK